MPALAEQVRANRTSAPRLESTVSNASLELAKSVGNGTQLWRTHHAVGKAHERAKRPDLASDHYRQASVTLIKTVDGLVDPTLRASLIQLPMVQRNFEIGARRPMADGEV